MEIITQLWSEAIGPILILILIVFCGLVVRYKITMYIRKQYGRRIVSFGAFMRYLTLDNDKIF